MTCGGGRTDTPRTVTAIEYFSHCTSSEAGLDLGRMQYILSASVPGLENITYDLS